MKSLTKNNKAESPLEIMVTIIVSMVIMIGVYFVYTLVLDAWIDKISNAPIQINQIEYFIILKSGLYKI